jgi:hypothetical protein
VRLSLVAILSSVIGMTAPSPHGIAQQTMSPGTSSKSAPATPGKAPSAGMTATNSKFKTEAQAKARCPSDTVVWANVKSKIYHFAGTKDYGKTKTGVVYMCEKDATAQGFRAAKNERRPAHLLQHPGGWQVA